MGNVVRDIVVDDQKAKGVIKEELLHSVETRGRGVHDERGGVTDCSHEVSTMYDVTHSLIREWLKPVRKEANSLDLSTNPTRDSLLEDLLHEIVLITDKMANIIND